MNEGEWIERYELPREEIVEALRTGNFEFTHISLMPEPITGWIESVEKADG